MLENFFFKVPQIVPKQMFSGENEGMMWKNPADGYVVSFAILAWMGDICLQGHTNTRTSHQVISLFLISRLCRRDVRQLNERETLCSLTAWWELNTSIKWWRKNTSKKRRWLPIKTEYLALLHGWPLLISGLLMWTDHSYWHEQL